MAFGNFVPNFQFAGGDAGVPNFWDVEEEDPVEVAEVTAQAVRAARQGTHQMSEDEANDIAVVPNVLVEPVVGQLATSGAPAATSGGGQTKELVSRTGKGQGRGESVADSF